MRKTAFNSSAIALLVLLGLSPGAEARKRVHCPKPLSGAQGLSDEKVALIRKATAPGGYMALSDLIKLARPGCLYFSERLSKEIPNPAMLFGYAHTVHSNRLYKVLVISGKVAAIEEVPVH